MRLQGKIAVVTGGGSGFGEGIAQRFAEEGATVVVADIDEAGGRRAADAIDGALFVATDVADNASMKALVETTVGEFGRVDIFVNNAGIAQRNGPMCEVTEAVFDRIFAVNVKSIYLSALHAVPVMREQGGGVFVNTASTAAVSPRPGLTWYNGSKGAVVTLTKSMAVELAPDNIRVNAVNPVIGETGLTVEFMGGEDKPEIREKFVSTIPLGRMSTPLDIANATLFLASDEAGLFLASDEAGLITGVCLEVDGGRCV